MRDIKLKQLRITLYLILVLCLAGALPGAGYAASGTVDKITASVTAAAPPPDKIAKRMTASVTTVGEQMLMGRTVEDVTMNQAGYEKLVREIFDRVLIGYSVTQVTIIPGATTHIQVAVTPWGDVVRDVSLEVDISGLSPELAALIKKDMGNVEEQIGNVLIGLPVDSVEWAGGVSKAVIREMLSGRLPEFRSNLEITAGERTAVKLSLVPSGPVVQDVSVALRSRTIPNVLLAEAGPAVKEAAGMLRGLPVAFVERHQDYFTEKISSAAASHPLASKYGLTLTPVIVPGTETGITLDIETDKYRVSLEGNLDVGRNEDNTSAKLHVGQFVGKRDEVFLEVSLIPSSFTWKFEPGWGRKLSETTAAGIRYDFSGGQSTLWFNKYAGANWTIRLERTPKTNYNEFGVRYKMHDFLSAEYVVNKKENWLRLIANL
ncbi:hypothetical protein SCACP_32620 [Sporomusa carbonis]|uniref:hypothetical protein n=1 Tax=Sporomusa carbonis TaxID=3076075 RepID=UPI003A652DD1